eukprot:scaffold5770_cov388-Prasinococcus_capsulatus_cf.AAC.9
MLSLAPTLAAVRPRATHPPTAASARPAGAFARSTATPAVRCTFASALREQALPGSFASLRHRRHARTNCRKAVVCSAEPEDSTTADAAPAEDDVAAELAVLALRVGVSGAYCCTGPVRGSD